MTIMARFARVNFRLSMRLAWRFCLSIPAFAGVVALDGCQTSSRPAVSEDGVRSTLVVGRSQDSATLQWESKRGVVYSVLFAKSRSSGAVWQPLPGYEKVPGTGETITIVDKIPYGVTRHYRLHVQLGSVTN